MNKTTNMGDSILDSFKKVLVKFKNAKFGFALIKNLPKLGDYFSDRDSSIFGKAKVLFSFVLTLIYFISPIDIIPEIILGPIGFLDDAFMLIWAIGNINEELEKYKGPRDSGLRGNKKVYKDPNIIDDASFTIKDDE